MYIGQLLPEPDNGTGSGFRFLPPAALNVYLIEIL
jgi:hypothetical protein